MSQRRSHDARSAGRIAKTQPRSGGRLARWRRALREYVVKRGMQAMCGSSDFVSPSVADDVPLISSGLRLAWLRALGAVGVRDIVARSGLGYRFVCHIGDLAEHPFYHRRAFEKELLLCAAWLAREERPVIYDLGANVGFISTHLAQILRPRSPQIYAFEPVPATFARLVRSVRRLGLSDCVHPVAAAVVDETRPVRIALSERSSLHSQVVPRAADLAHANGYAYASGITLDAFSASVGRPPSLVKMDVEGSEVAALRGARRLLAGDGRPAVLFEHNPVTLAEFDTDVGALRALLAGYRFHYVDDLEGQRLPFGQTLSDEVDAIDWTCNIFATPMGDGADARWRAALQEARQRLEKGSP